jgi:two-component system, response regulator
VTREMVEILLVEDNAHDVELTLHAFEKRNLGKRVHVVRDGQEALDYLLGDGEYAWRKGAPQPRVVLLDLKLPKIDGLEVLRAIRRDPELHSLPVVVLTSSREDRDLVESYELGVNSYIVKPIEFSSFVETASTLGLYWLLLNEAPRAAAGFDPDDEAAA